MRGGHTTVTEDLQEFWFGEVEPEGFAGDFELVVVYVPVFVQVEERKLLRMIRSVPLPLAEVEGGQGILTASRISSLCSSLKLASSSCALRSCSCLSRSRSNLAFSRACCVVDAPNACPDRSGNLPKLPPPYGAREGYDGFCVAICLLMRV